MSEMTAFVHYLKLDTDEKLAVHQWLTDHGVDYTRVPIYAQFDRDDATGEWRIPVYWVDDDGKMRIDHVTEEIRLHVVRCRELRPLPWPVVGP